MNLRNATTPSLLGGRLLGRRHGLLANFGRVEKIAKVEFVEVSALIVLEEDVKVDFSRLVRSVQKRGGKVESVRQVLQVLVVLGSGSVLLLLLLLSLLPLLALALLGLLVFLPVHQVVPLLYRLLQPGDDPVRVLPLVVALAHHCVLLGAEFEECEQYLAVLCLGCSAQ